MEQILLPNTIEFKETGKPNVGEVIITPCHQGYGTTLGNAFRRALLSSLPGSAVESVKISGVQHEFAHIDGVAEDVVEIIMNLKQLAVRNFSNESVVITLSKKGLGEVKASDFAKNSDVEIVNPDLKLATITSADKTLEMEITIGNGRGYVPVSEKNTKNYGLGTIAIDSLYTPIRDVGYNIELTRVGDITDFEKLILTIETNGTITSKEAVAQAAKILLDYFGLVLEATNEKKSVKEDENIEKPSEDATEEVVEEVEEVKEKKSKKKAKS